MCGAFIVEWGCGMLIEAVICDHCQVMVPMPDRMVPASFIQYDGRHYCSRACFGVVTE